MEEFFLFLLYFFWTAVARVWSMSMNSWGGSASVMPVRHSCYDCWLYYWFYSRQHLSLEHVHEFVAGSICDARAAQLRRLCVSMCTFVLVKQVNWVVICEIPVRHSCSFCVGICTFCTSEASKLSSNLSTCRRVRPMWSRRAGISLEKPISPMLESFKHKPVRLQDFEVFCVRICTSVLVTQVNWAPAARFWGFLRQNLYFCTSTASKLITCCCYWCPGPGWTMPPGCHSMAPSVYLLY